MATLREIKRKARRSLHTVLRVQAMYLVPIPPPVGSTGPGPFYDTPVPINVRLHTTFEPLGDMKGTSFHYAEKQAVVPQIVFMRDEVDKPVRGALVSVEAGEAYRVDNTHPPDDITVKADVVRLPEAATTGLPVPGDP